MRVALAELYKLRKMYKTYGGRIVNVALTAGMFAVFAGDRIAEMAWAPAVVMWGLCVVAAVGVGRMWTREHSATQTGTPGTEHFNSAGRELSPQGIVGKEKL